MTYDEVSQQIRTDVDYALRQVKTAMGHVANRLGSGDVGTDALQRAIDALERVQSRLIPEPPELVLTEIADEIENNEYEIVTPTGSRIQWFAETHTQARREAEEAGHKVKAVTLKR